MELSVSNFSSSWESREKITVSWTAEMSRQCPLCDAGVVACVTLAGFVIFTEMYFSS